MAIHKLPCRAKARTRNSCSKMTDDLTRVYENVTSPIVLRGALKGWGPCEWNLQRIAAIFGHRKLPFRIASRTSPDGEFLVASILISFHGFPLQWLNYKCFWVCLQVIQHGSPNAR